MPKRKLDELEGVSSQESSSRKLGMQRKRLEVVLDHGKKRLFGALKISRGFERQKLGRRQKQAQERQSDANLSRLAAEIAKLKDLDLSATGEMYLFKTLSKIKKVAANPAFSEMLQATAHAPTQAHDAIHVTVTARLFNSSPVRDAMDVILGEVREALDIAQLESKKRRMRKADFATRDEALRKSTLSADPHDKHVQELRQGIRGDGAELATRKDSEDDDSEPEPYGKYLDQLVSSSSDISDENRDDRGRDKSYRQPETVSTASSEDHEFVGKSLGRIYHSVEDPTYARVTTSEDVDASDLETSLVGSERKIKITQRPKAIAPVNKTIFLPSLAMGGYWSGSDSAANSSDEEAAAIKPRKNRMGQAARRALWEKKYGAKANHVKTQKPNRDAGWDARKGAQGERGARRGGRGSRHSEQYINRSDKTTSGANSDPIGTKKEKSDTATLHPSWEAAKRKKEQNKSVAFEGQKITFD